MAEEFDFGGAFLRGVSARRQVEETRTLIQDRALKDEARVRMSQLEQQLSEVAAGAIVNEARFKELWTNVQAGEAVSQVEFDKAANAWATSLMEADGKAVTLTNTMLSQSQGNPYLMEAVRNRQLVMFENSKRMQEGLIRLNEMRMQQTQMQIEGDKAVAAIDASRASAYAERTRAGVMLNQDAREAELQPYKVEGAQAEIGQTRAQTELIGAQTEATRGEQRRQDEIHPSQVRFYAAGARAKESEARTIEGKEAIDGLEVLNRASALVSALSKPNENGGTVAPEVINNELGKYMPGLTMDKLNQMRDDMSQQARDQIDSLTPLIERERRRVADGEADGSELSSLIRQQKRIETAADREAAEQIEWEDIRRYQGNLAYGIQKLQSYFTRAPKFWTWAFGMDYQPQNAPISPADRPSVNERVERSVNKELQ